MFIHETDAVNIVREYREMKSKTGGQEGGGRGGFCSGERRSNCVFFFQPRFFRRRKINFARKFIMYERSRLIHLSDR